MSLEYIYTWHFFHENLQENVVECLIIEFICTKVMYMYVGTKHINTHLGSAVYKFEIKHYFIVNLHFLCNFLDAKNE